jgi:hypothetical protein
MSTPTTPDLKTSITTALSTADSTASTRVQTLSLVHQARVTQLTRAAAAAQANYGAGSTQATAAQAALTTATATSARVAQFKQQVTTPAPQVAATGWVLHGRVYDAARQPVPGATVYLVDEQHAYQRAYGFCYTDSTGYFLLNDPGTQTTGQDAADAAAPSLYLAAVNAKAQPVYLGTTKLALTTGGALYQTITLPAGEPPIGDPPEAIRRLALPADDTD